MSESIAQLRFHASEIQEKAGLAASTQVPSEALLDGVSCEGRLVGPVRIEAEFSVGGNRILLQGTVAGAWRLPCGRCLAEHALEFRSELDETYGPETPVIDLTDDVRQAVLLEIPSRSLCRPDCKGLCPRCGKNLNEGPCGCKPAPAAPFDSLKRLKKN